MGGIPRVSTSFRLNVENEQADAGRDGRTRLARQIFRREWEQENIHGTGSMDREHGPFLQHPFSHSRGVAPHCRNRRGNADEMY